MMTVSFRPGHPATLFRQFVRRAGIQRLCPVAVDKWPDRLAAQGFLAGPGGHGGTVVRGLGKML
jgi:hypothetical protein